MKFSQMTIWLGCCSRSNYHIRLGTHALVEDEVFWRDWNSACIEANHVFSEVCPLSIKWNWFLELWECILCFCSVMQFASFCWGVPVTIELASYLLDWPSPAQIKKILQFLSSNQGSANKLARLKYTKLFGALCLCVPNTVIHDESIFYKGNETLWHWLMRTSL
jgi:hypothetical protein